MKTMDKVASADSALALLVDRIDPTEKPGAYDPKTQTWSHRSQADLSPVKHHQEM